VEDVIEPVKLEKVFQGIFITFSAGSEPVLEMTSYLMV